MTQRVKLPYLPHCLCIERAISVAVFIAAFKDFAGVSARFLRLAFTIGVLDALRNEPCYNQPLVSSKVLEDHFCCYNYQIGPLSDLWF